MSVKKSIVIGSDHRGFAIKQHLVQVLIERGYTVRDMGTDTADAVDYPDIACPVAESVSCGMCPRGVLICGSGIGMSVVANKFSGVRAALCNDARAAEMSRRHNNANILVLGSAAGLEGATAILDAWLAAPFEGGRHQQRLDKIAAHERRVFTP